MSQAQIGTLFLFMDERYPDDSLPPPLHYAGLTGVLVDSLGQVEFRARYYKALAEAYPAPENTVPRAPAVHASNLFRDLGDDDVDPVRLAFLRSIVKAIVSLELVVLNIGYFRTKEHMEALKVDKPHFGERVLGLCFLGFLFSLEESMKGNVIWPVIERDRKDFQELTFSAMTREADHAVARIPSLRRSHTVDFLRLGETLYSNKYSALSSAADICSYLLNKRFLRDNGVPLSPYAQSIAELGDELAPAVKVDEIIRMRIGA